MATRTQIAETLRERFAGVAERGRVLGEALKMRADMAVTRRRLRTTMADLGEKIFLRMESGEAEELCQDPLLVSYQERICGLKAELRIQESELREVMHSPGKSAAPTGGAIAVEEAVSPEAEEDLAAE